MLHILKNSGYYDILCITVRKEGYALVFSSLIFLCLFLPAFLAVYNISKNTAYRNIILVLFSLIFYAWGEPVWVILLIFSAAIDYINGLIIDKYYATNKARLALASSLILNLGLLGIFKYSGFITQSINMLLPFKLPVPKLSLPIGISFYTFQTLSYTIDVYRGKTKVQRSFMRFLAYVSMFPQLVAGPIVRYTDVSRQLHKRNVTATDFSHGAKRFTAGLCKKVLLANNAGNTAQMLLSASIPTTASSWLGIIMYTFQIYFDFSGYSDMAIGMGRMLGFRFAENFDYPYISKSITDFWRRWHISLSSFFRDYVYIPLGGGRLNPVRNILFVWILTGLWHGASWNFILWGAFYGILLILEKFPLKKVINRLSSPFCYIYTMFFVVMGWGIFYFTDLTELWAFLRHAFGFGCDLYDLTTASALYSNLWFIVICILVSTPIPKVMFRHFCKKSEVIANIAEPLVMIIGFALSFLMLVGQTYNPFLYFRF